MGNLSLISVIITTMNEENNIENCLRSIIKQSYSSDMIEIIVVDNNSTDKTKKKVEEFIRGFNRLNVKLFNYGPERSAQRNYGVKNSNGEYFLYLDADMILHKDVIRDCVKLIQIENQKLSTENLIALYISEIVSGNKYWSKVRRFERSFYDGTVIDCVRFIKKNFFLKAGGFDENLTGPEDWDLDKKLRNIGKVELIKTPIYHNEARFNLKKYIYKKGYYAKNFDNYIKKWGKNDPDIKKQFGLYYRFFGVFIENGKWIRLISYPHLTFGMYFLRFLVGLRFLFR
jgi:glycosyltransferase involved in cell wall biosynthesis